MKIRTANAADSEQIANIHANSWRETYSGVLSAAYLRDVVPDERSEIWKARLSEPKVNQIVLVMEDRDAIVGFACAYSGENPKWGSYLDNLHVRKAFHGQGIGTELMRAIVRWCVGRAPNQGLCLLVNQDNTRAQRFYLKLGARKAEAAVWHAPDDSIVPTFWFVWDTLDELSKHSEK